MAQSFSPQQVAQGKATYWVPMQSTAVTASAQNVKVQINTGLQYDFHVTAMSHTATSINYAFKWGILNSQWDNMTDFVNAGSVFLGYEPFYFPKGADIVVPAGQVGLQVYINENSGLKNTIQIVFFGFLQLS